MSFASALIPASSFLPLQIGAGTLFSGIRQELAAQAGASGLGQFGLYTFSSCSSTILFLSGPELFCLLYTLALFAPPTQSPEVTIWLKERFSLLACSSDPVLGRIQAALQLALQLNDPLFQLITSASERSVSADLRDSEFSALPWARTSS